MRLPGNTEPTFEPATPSRRASVVPYGVLALVALSATVDQRYQGMSPRALAAIVAHELRHAANWAGARAIAQPLTSWNCDADKASAFLTEAAVWRQLRNNLPADSLESAEEKLTNALDSHALAFWLNKRNEYESICKARIFG